MICVATIGSYIPAGYESNQAKKEQFALDDEFIAKKLGVDVEHATAYSILLYTRLLIIALLGGVVELAVNLRTFRAGFSD